MISICAARTRFISTAVFSSVRVANSSGLIANAVSSFLANTFRWSIGCRSSKYLTPITGGFTAGENPITFDLHGLNAKTSVLICFEDMFPHYAREHAADEVDFLLNLTNDGWFGESAAHWQQAASAAFRAVENGRPLVRCANNGISCWIDRFGRMKDVYFENSRDVYQAGFKVIDVPVTAARRSTFYNRHGDWFGWSCVAIAGVALLMRLSFRKRD
jgi:apolipoprotein N-acyltransferase